MEEVRSMDGVVESTRRCGESSSRCRRDPWEPGGENGERRRGDSDS